MPEKKTAPEAITELLQRWSQGDSHALNQLVPLVYHDLRKIAANQMRGERPEHTLQPTALANEVYLKLARQPNQKWASRAHFLAVASMAMRQVLVDHARIRNRKKRKRILVPLEDIEVFAAARPAEFLALDDALTKLTATDGRKSQVVELRIFGGLKDQEIAELLGISITTVERDFRFAIAWLRRAMSGKSGTDRKTKKAG
jgi:RNA polymerase sigma factor (TIGR02999 family)